MSFPRRARASLFRIPRHEATFDRRGFPEADPGKRSHLERVEGVVLDGYHAALEFPEPMALVDQLEEIEPAFRGFAFEGAGMALTLLDSISPWRRDRFRRLTEGEGAAYAIVLHLGAGRALARRRSSIPRAMSRMDPLLGWLALDGFGFYHGFFHWQAAIEAQRRPPRLRGYARRAFDQGLGRGLWFYAGADTERVVETIQRFAADRHSDLWAGVGLAATDAGGVSRTELESLRERSGAHAPWLAQGSAFAAKARYEAANPVPHMLLACEVLCDVPAEVAAKVCDEALMDLSPNPSAAVFEVWRRRIADALRLQAPLTRL